MISPELLRRYPFFAPFDEGELRALALIAEECEVKSGTVLFEEGAPADHLYLLIEGSVDLFTVVREEYHPASQKEFLLGEINPGDVFAISALIEPNRCTASGRAGSRLRMISFDAVALRALFAADCHLGYTGMVQTAKTLSERLTTTRNLLAAAWS